MIKKIRKMKQSVSPPRPLALGKSPGPGMNRHRSPPKVNIVVKGGASAAATATSQGNSMLNMASASTLAAASAASSRNDSSSAKKADEVDETPKTATRLNRASSSGKDTEAGETNFTQAAQKCEEAASPRYKFDIETRKFVLAKDRSPRHRVVAAPKLTKAQLLKRM